MTTTVVFSGGPVDEFHVVDGLQRAVAEDSRTPEVVIAADSGLASCLAAGLLPDVVVGDMDSVRPGDLEAAEAAGALIERHPRDKDAVDLELALEVAVERSPVGTGSRQPGSVAPRPRLLLVGSAAGRLDHLLASMLLIGSSRYGGFEIDALFGTQRVLPVHDERTIAAEPGRVLSLLALHGPGSRVSTVGLAWPLEDHELQPDSSLGVSNEFSGVEATIQVSGPPVTVVLSQESSTGDSRSVDPDEPERPAASGGGADD